TLRVRVETNRIAGYVNGALVTESNDVELRGGKVGLAKFRDTKAQFKNFYLGTNPPAIDSVPPEFLVATTPVEGGSGRSDAEIIASLKSSGGAGHAVLLERARQLDRAAEHMRRVASAFHAKSVESALLNALKEPEGKIDLFHAALLVAKLDNAE